MQTIGFDTRNECASETERVAAFDRRVAFELQVEIAIAALIAHADCSQLEKLAA
jgi:hypothetical protein